MITNEFSQLLVNSPLAVLLPAIISVVLIALTMYSVIKRERAMIRERRYDPGAKVAYVNRWRNRTVA